MIRPGPACATRIRAGMTMESYTSALEPRNKRLNCKSCGTGLSMK